MKTKIPNAQVRRKTIEVRDMLEDLHVFVEKINLCIAQNPKLSHDSKVKYTRVILDNGVSHMFELGNHRLQVDLQTDIDTE
ncbi:hypothetical protein [Dysgonomonas macrotermitis]|uniref:Uncharacterized protein n=1 Tax=Dysgonomonas macrotermitis TaxID=1346286 RepID=A0A1M4UK34_9BACT|nr:hypothetical protein [Dysgonomonas macrotermitis]SHE56930.1 hypothetical protein SAMN05444362_101624 [Dysgonomonas macrotermitis]